MLQVTNGVGWQGGQVGTTEVGQDSRRPLPCTCLPPQGNQMSIMFLEPAYPAPGHVHRGQLQLVEVSTAGLGLGLLAPWPSPGKVRRALGCCARSTTDSDPGSGRGSSHTATLRHTFLVARGGYTPDPGVPSVCCPFVSLCQFPLSSWSWRSSLLTLHMLPVPDFGDVGLPACTLSPFSCLPVTEVRRFTELQCISFSFAVRVFVSCVRKSLSPRSENTCFLLKVTLSPWCVGSPVAAAGWVCGVRQARRGWFPRMTGLPSSVVTPPARAT